MPDPTLSPPAIVQSAEDLSALFDEAKAECHMLEVVARQELDRARKFGRLMLRIKAACKPGEFQAEVKKRMPGKLATCYRAIRVVSEWSKIERANDVFDGLQSLTDTCKMAGDDEEETTTFVPNGAETSHVRRPTPCSAEDATLQDSTVNDLGAGKTVIPTPPKTNPVSPMSTLPADPEGPFDDLMKEVSRLARRFTEAMKEETPESKRLHDYLAWAGLVDHARGQIVDPTKVEGDGREKAGVAFLPLKGVKAVLELAAAPGPARTPNEVQHAYDVASGGFVPPITARRRKKKRKPGTTPTGYTDTEF